MSLVSVTGTVVGTYGWVDPNGYLRLRDYVADNQGYRIIKSKLIYVGRDAINGDSPTETSNPKYSPIYQTPVQNQPFKFDGLPPWRSTTYLSPHRDPEHRYATETPETFYSSTPLVEISANSLTGSSTPSYIASDSSPEVAFYEDVTVRPISELAPPRPDPYNYGSTPHSRTYAGPSEDISPATHPTRPLNTLSIPAIGVVSTTPLPVSGKFLPSVGSNDITEAKKFYLADNERNFEYRAKVSGDEHEEYDGISTVQNGFRYYLPKHYHEETFLSGGQERAGSFGYIDPFGIRRVIYYNTSPEKGFVHRKNNRYVGFHSTPYDPRPNF